MNQPSPPVALVTGGARRIGAVMVRRLHQAGYRVLLHYRSSRDDAFALAGELNGLRAASIHCLQADLLDLRQVERLAHEAVAQWGRLDVLLNNASAFYPVPLAELDEGDWNELVHSNARAPLFLSKHLAPALVASSGCIVSIADSTARHGVAGFTPYTMAKAALANMTRSLARELAPHVRVNAISPGAILWPEYGDGISDAEKQQTITNTALGRMGTPEDIAHAALFLIRDAHYMTGQVIAVDGGATLGI